MDYLPWWAGALALAAIGTGYFWLTGMRMGVSGMWGRIVDWRIERANERTAASWQADPAALEAALMAATLKAFGDRMPKSDTAPATSPSAADSVPARPPLTAALVFLLMLIVGGSLAALTRGTLSVQADLGGMGPEFTGIFGDGWLGLVALIGGGVLVGFGTRMAGGCTSGHGLCGCSRLQVGSIVATVAFFGAGVVVSLALAGVWS